jgi:hypothetical protein
MKKGWIFFIIAILLLGGIGYYFFLLYSEGELSLRFNTPDKFEDIQLNLSNSNTSSFDLNNKSLNVSYSAEGLGRGGGGSSSNSVGTTQSLINDTLVLPSDLDTNECGFYFSEYAVCSGKCAVGSCTLDGRSCYCKI